MKQITYWKAKIREAKKALESAVRAELPLGCTISYKHGKHDILGVVIEHGLFCDDIKVRGNTGAEYWINLWRVEQCVDMELLS